MNCRDKFFRQHLQPSWTTTSKRLPILRTQATKQRTKDTTRRRPKRKMPSKAASAAHVARDAAAAGAAVSGEPVKLRRPMENGRRWCAKTTLCCATPTAKNRNSRRTADPENGYVGITFSPDSKSVVSFRMEPGDHKEVYRIQSSPAGTGGAKAGGVGRAVLQTSTYALPGDKLDSYELNVFDVESKKQFKPLGEEKIDMNPDGGDPNPTFNGPNANLRWRKDGKHFTVEKYDRGHQRVRLIEVDATTGETRNVLDEKTDTFIWSAHNEAIGVRLINYLRNEDEVLYISEMDGWRHFYMIDVPTGKLKQITKGQWIVRGVNRIDEDARQIWFTASGVYPDQDPYFVHYGRVNFDGTGLTWLTSGNGNHTINFGGEGIPRRGAAGNATAGDATSSFSPDGKYVIDSYSRVDQPPITELRRVSDGQLVCAGKSRVDGAVRGAGSLRRQRARWHN